MSGLPTGWIETTLGEIGSWHGGGTPDKSNPEYWSSGTIPWVSPKDMKRFYISEAEDQITEAALAGSSTNLIAAKSVLIVTRSGILKHTLPVAVTGREVAINQDIKALTPLPELDALFIAQQIKSLGSFVLKNCTKAGTTVDSVDFDRLKSVNANIPPLAEQKRIVAKLDTLNAKSTRARTELARIETLVSRCKQAVLSKAFSGELMASEVSGWVLSTLGELALDVRYGTAEKCTYAPELTPVLRIPNVADGSIDLSDLKHALFTEKELKKLVLVEGDLLVIRSNGSVDLVGRSAVVDSAAAGMLFAGYLIRIRLDLEKASPSFIQLWMQSSEVRRTIENAAKSTSGVNNVNSQQLQALQLQLPPLEEQHEIVRRIESVVARIDRLAAEARRGLELVGRLDAAILAKAFRGELVPQDENDEPAEKLLERIRTERAAGPKAKRGHRQAPPSERTAKTRRTTEMTKTRGDVEQNHLAQLLRETGGSKSPTELWLQSGMDIDEFYKQLRSEIDSGQIREGTDKDQLVLIDAN